MRIHETFRADGSAVSTRLVFEAGVLAIVEEGSPSLALPDGALEAVMKRYGRPLDAGEPVTEVALLVLGDGRTLRHVRHLARWDVIARDWLVFEAPGAEALCAMATTVAGALAHLARASAR